MELQYSTDSISSLYKRIFPAAAGSLLTASVASLIDALILSNILGPIMLSSISVCMPLYMLINSLAMLIASGGATVYAIYIGKNQRQEANRYFTTAFFSILVVGAILMLAGVLFTGDIVRYLGANDAIFAATFDYVRVLMFFVIPLMLYCFMLFFIRFDSDPNLTLIGTIVCAAVNLVLDIIFVGPLGWGPAGAALATCLAYTVALIVNCTHFLRKKNTLKFVFSKWSLKRLLRSVKTGLPLSISQFGLAVCTSVFNILLISVGGESTVAIYAIITQLSMVALAIYEGIGQAAQPIFAANLGAGNKTRIYETFRFGIVFELVANGICLALLFVLAEPVARLFAITDFDMLSQAVWAIRIYALALPVTGLNVLIMYYFQARESSLRANTIALLHASVSMIAVLYLIIKLLPFRAIWFTWLIAEGITFIVSFILYKFERKG